MLLENNPKIDYAQLIARVEREMVEFCGEQRLAPVSGADLEVLVARLNSEGLEREGGGFRGFIRRQPIIGSLAIHIYRSWKIFSNSHLGWRARILAFPGLGVVVKWGYGQLTELRYRHHVHEELLKQNHLGWQLGKTVQALQSQLQLQQRQIEFSNGQLKSLSDELKEAQYQLRVYADRALIPSESSSVQVNPLRQDLLDRYYVDFENAFRGERDDIKLRQRPYLGFLEEAGLTEEDNILDVGCGRGEWLELLGENGYSAYGLDLNSHMVRLCCERGLKVKLGDVIAHLDSLPRESLGAVTGFQLIEHLGFKQLLRLFDAALRVLKPNGLIIFETPNPENLQVGAYTFYNDPTHRNPIPPAVAAFIAKQCGFSKTHIERVNPYPDSARMDEESPIGREYNRLFCCAQDYALIGWKNHEN
ncbi:methyltransferase domain-containing protein [Laribacter hongkongensis]|nr:methyltransferase domain-containing protein [Laribacter hongkongensis]